jgi:hypothetical protein
MNIRWRLVILATQLVLLGCGTWLATGRIYSGEIWFIAGLLSVVINPQLLEPFYPRPVDVLANSIIGLVLFFIVKKNIVGPGWKALASGFTISIILSAVALGLGTRKGEGILTHLGRAANVFTRPLTARVIYSAIFWLALLEFDSGMGSRFWILGGAWAVIMLISKINWQNAWAILSGAPTTAQIEGMIGPSRLLISAPTLPPLGSGLSLLKGQRRTEGILIGRVRRESDVWGQVLVPSLEDCEAIRTSSAVKIEAHVQGQSTMLGAVDIGSTENSLCFTPIQNLEMGNVVSVNRPEGGFVLYQIASAEVGTLSAKKDSHLIVRVEANQLGYFNRDSLRLERHRWVPCPGAPVVKPSVDLGSGIEIPNEYIRLGQVIGTNLPIFLDWRAACEGHLAILGMTKMGKTSLAVRIAQTLATDRRVVVLDQTGEYIGRRRLPRYEDGCDWYVPGLCVIEAPPNQVAADFAFRFLEEVVSTAMEEYTHGNLHPRVLIIDEAHQFIPEPTGLGFNAPGRDSAYKFGITMMQIRKYGIAVVLVSQRTAVVAKSALSQCENLIAFRNVDQTGLDYLEAIAGSGVRKLLPQLKQGEAIVFGPAISTDGAVAIQIDYNLNREPHNISL